MPNGIIIGKIVNGVPAAAELRMPSAATAATSCDIDRFEREHRYDQRKDQRDDADHCLDLGVDDSFTNGLKK